MPDSAPDLTSYTNQWYDRRHLTPTHYLEARINAAIQSSSRPRRPPRKTVLPHNDASHSSNGMDIDESRLALLRSPASRSDTSSEFTLLQSPSHRQRPGGLIHFLAQPQAEEEFLALYEDAHGHPWQPVDSDRRLLEEGPTDKWVLGKWVIGVVEETAPYCRFVETCEWIEEWFPGTRDAGYARERREKREEALEGEVRWFKEFVGWEDESMDSDSKFGIKREG